MKNVLFISVLFIILASLTQAAYYSDVVSQLQRFQDPSGAFKANPRAPVSLQATQDSLFLYSVYGLQRKVDVNTIPDFLNIHRNSDGGFGSAPGAPSTLESTWRAVSSYAHLKVAVPESQRIASFVKSQVDSNGVFISNFPAPGNFGDIVSTYYALDILNILGEPTSNSEVNAFLKQNEGPSKFNFATQQENLYAILVAKLSGYKIAGFQEFARQIASFQTTNGGFIEDSANPVLSFRSTALSVEAIKALEESSEKSLSTLIGFDRIVSFVQTVPYDVSLAYWAHRTLIFSPYFKNNFKLVTPFESTPPVKDGNILFGSQFKVGFSARAFGGVSNSGFSVAVSLSFADQTTKDIALPWDNEKQQFEASEFLSASVLGPVSATFRVEYSIPTVGDISFVHTAEGSIGYNVQLSVDATHELTGRKVSAGDSVSVGTTFALNVLIKDKSNKIVSSGPFDVVFYVVDSSNAVIETSSIPATDNKGPFQFTYTLASNNLPPGHLSFVAELKSHGKSFNAQKIQYIISTPLVAAELKFDPEYQLGDEVEISFVPAVFPDHRSIVPIAPEQRTFILDITSESGKVLNSVRGAANENTVNFGFAIESTFDFIGTLSLSFRYVTVDGLSVVVGTYNAENEEILDELPSFKVNAELHVVDISEQPGQNDFFYGNDIVFKYDVEDKLTKKRVEQGKYGYSYLAVNHFDEQSGRTFTSTKEVATQTDEGLVVNWEINPNAVEGKGTLVLAAVDASGNDVPLLETKTQKVIAFEVTIGGEITETKDLFDSVDFYATHSSFVLQFGLTCHHKALRNAKLRASILRLEGGKFKEVSSIPVASSGDFYSASYTPKHKELPSGEYKIQIFRESDQTRASEAQDERQKLLVQKQREAELNGEEFDQEEFLASFTVQSEVKPILETSFTHKEVTKGGLPIRTEWLVLIPLFVGFIYFDTKKRSYGQQKAIFTN